MLTLSAYVMKGRFQAITAAMLMALLSLLLPPFTILSTAIVALVTLRKGFREGLIVIGGAGLAGIVFGQLAVGAPMYAVTYLMIQWLPVWLAANVLRETGQQFFALGFLAALGILAIVVFYLFSSDPAGQWAEIIGSMLKPVVEMGPGAEQGVLMENLDAISQYMMGIVVMSSLASLSLALFLARWWQANLYNPGGFGGEFLAFRIPKPVAILAMVIAVVAAAGMGFLSELAGNVVLPLAVLFLITGVSVLHCLFSTLKAKRFLLMGLYLMLILVPHVLPPLALVGLADTWLNIRRYIRKENS